MPEQSRATERKFSALFVLLLGYLVLYPYGQNAGLPYLAFRVFGVALTILSLYAVSFERRYVWFGLMLAVPAFAERVLVSTNPGALSIVSIAFGFAFDLFIIAVLFRRVFMTEDPTREAIFGALCIYLLIGFSFASMFGMLASVQPQAFYMDPTVNRHTMLNRFDLIYYSFATVTCLGATGITPVSTQARSLTVVESLLGLLYLAVLISRLLNAYNTRGLRSY
jgi:Ion channel